MTWDEVQENYNECSTELLEFIKWGGNGGSAEPSKEAIAAGKKREAERRAKIGAESRAERETAKSTPASKDNYADGVVGQFQRLGDKMSGNQSKVNKAKSYEASKNELRTKNVNAGGNASDKIDQAAINKRTAERRKADPNYKAGQGVDSGAKPTKPVVKKEKEVKKDPNAGGGGGGGGGGGNGGGGGGGKVTPAPVAKATPAKQTGDKKADMASWAKANPKLAAAKKQRDSTRGTSASSNPMMRDLAKRMPKPVAPVKAATPAPAARPTPAARPAPAAAPAAKRPLTPTAAPKTGAAATSALKKFTAKEEVVDVFDTILAHLIEQGFGDDEALILMTSMSEEKRQQMLALISEEGSDAMKDKQLENGGHAARSDYDRPTRNPATGDKKKGETPLQKAAKEKYGAGASAMDIVRAKIKAQHGDKAIKDTKKD